MLRLLAFWRRPQPPTVRVDFDTEALYRGGGLMRYRTRSDLAPVNAFDRAGFFIFGMIAGVALVGAGVIVLSGRGI